MTSQISPSTGTRALPPLRPRPTSPVAASVLLYLRTTRPPLHQVMFGGRFFTLTRFPACPALPLSQPPPRGIPPLHVPLPVTLLTYLTRVSPLSGRPSLKSIKKWRGYTLLLGLTCPPIRKLTSEVVEPPSLWRVSVALRMLRPPLTFDICFISPRTILGYYPPRSVTPRRGLSLS